MEIDKITENIKWLGHDTVRLDSIDNYPVIYFDPYQIEQEPEGDREKFKAGIILITHEHYDHCSSEDVEKIIGEHTVIVTENDSAEKLKKELGKSVEGKIEVLTPEESITLYVKGETTYNPVTIQAVPSYNIDKKFHPKNKNWLGFIVDIGGVKIYHAGDTDLISEMSNIKCDIALLPVSGTYVMTADEAVKAALEIKPKLAIPMHYGSLVGTESDAEVFKKALKGRIDVKILRKEH